MDGSYRGFIIFLMVRESFVLCYVSICNGMVSSLEKTCIRRSKLHEFKIRMQFSQTHECVFLQNCTRNNYTVVNNVKGNVRDNTVDMYLHRDRSPFLSSVKTEKLCP